jgi:Asp-tRNA(Asn)/Glu-tRNA(Gln) amidotransferase B subunit
MKIGYGLSKDDAEWWNRYEIWRYGNRHADSRVFFYADILDSVVLSTYKEVTAQSISEFSKITINNIRSQFENWMEFYDFMLNYGVEIMQFLCQYQKSTMTYKIKVVTKFVDMNMYCKCGTVSDIITLFPDDTVSDNEQLIVWVDSVIVSNEKAVTDFKKGKLGVLNSLKGQVMKLSGGKANINLVGDLLLTKLS